MILAHCYKPEKDHNISLINLEWSESVKANGYYFISVSFLCNETIFFFAARTPFFPEWCKFKERGPWILHLNIIVSCNKKATYITVYTRLWVLFFKGLQLVQQYLTWLCEKKFWVIRCEKESPLVNASQNCIWVYGAKHWE